MIEPPASTRPAPNGARGALAKNEFRLLPAQNLLPNRMHDLLGGIRH